jgi:hypothetical protein
MIISRESPVMGAGAEMPGCIGHALNINGRHVLRCAALRLLVPIIEPNAKPV